MGAFLIYDITNRQSFVNLTEWLDKIREYSDEYVQIALIGNKRDLVELRDNNDESYIKLRSQMFKNLINENEDDDPPKRLQPDYKIESI